MKNNNSSIKTVVAVGIGAALFFVLGRFVPIPFLSQDRLISLYDFEAFRKQQNEFQSAWY